MRLHQILAGRPIRLCQRRCWEGLKYWAAWRESSVVQWTSTPRPRNTNGSRKNSNRDDDDDADDDEEEDEDEDDADGNDNDDNDDDEEEDHEDEDGDNVVRMTIILIDTLLLSSLLPLWS